MIPIIIHVGEFGGGVVASSRRHILVALSTAGTLLAATLTGAASASATTTDLPVVIDMDDLSAFVDIEDDPISIISDDSDGGERHIVGAQLDGSRVEITVFLSDTEAVELPTLSTLVTDFPDITESTTTALIDEDDLSPLLVTARTATTVSIAWAAPTGADQFEVLADGLVVQQGTEPNLTLIGLEPDTALSLQLRSFADPIIPEEEEPGGDDPEEEPTEPEEPELPVEPQTLDTLMTLSVSTLAEDEPLARGNAGPAPLSPVKSTEVSWRTYLPFEYIKDSTLVTDRAIEGQCIADAALWRNDTDMRGNWNDYSFKGDNRTEAVPPVEGVENYRTRMNARMDWTTGTWTHSKDVGTTRIWNLREDEEAYSLDANTSQMLFGGDRKLGSLAQIEFYHVANDPFCFSFGRIGAIAYTGSITMHRSGLITIVGERAKMPSYEGWVRWNDSSQWSNVFALDAVGLHCLVLQIPLGCEEPILASSNRSSDRWKNIEGSLASTKKGASYGWGSGAALLPTVNNDCSTQYFLPAPTSKGTGIGRLSRLNQSNSHGTALTASGKIITWGKETLSQEWPYYGSANYVETGNLGRTGDPLVGSVVSGTTFVDFDTFGETTYAISASGDIYTWGPVWWASSYPPTPFTDRYDTPTLMKTGNFTKITADRGNNYIIALDSAGETYFYAWNEWGWGGEDSENMTWTDPAWVKKSKTGVDFSDVAVMGSSIFALDTLGRLWSTGLKTIALDGLDEVDAAAGWNEWTLADTTLHFESLADDGSELSLMDVNNNHYAFDQWVEYVGVEATESPALPYDQLIVEYSDRRAISNSGEMYELVEEYNETTEEYDPAWTLLDLPPTTVVNPTIECSTLGRSGD